MLYYLDVYWLFWNYCLHPDDEEEEEDFVLEDSRLAVNNTLNHTSELLNRNLTQANDVLNSEENIADALNSTSTTTQESFVAEPDDLKVL